MGIRLRRAKENRAYYDPNIGRANYDMDQRVTRPPVKHRSHADLGWSRI